MKLNNKCKWLSIIGLLFGMIGVAIIFFYGPPQPSFNPYSYLIDDTINQEVLNLRDMYDTFSQIGLSFVFFGFVLQLIAVFFSGREDKKSKGKIKPINSTDNEMS